MVEAVGEKLVAVEKWMLKHETELRLANNVHSSAGTEHHCEWKSCNSEFS